MGPRSTRLSGSENIRHIHAEGIRNAADSGTRSTSCARARCQRDANVLRVPANT